MHLIGLVSAIDHVCCRYRLSAFRPYLEQAGHSLELIPLPKSIAQRWKLFRRLRGATVVLQRFLLPGWQLGLLRQSARHLVFDFDDAVFLRDSYSRRGHYNSRRLHRFVATVRASDAIIAGNNYLAEQAILYTTEDRVEVIPTCVDPALYSPRQSAGAGLQLVWIGSSSTLQGLERNADLFETIARRLPDVRLKIICDRFPHFATLPIVSCCWREDTEGSELADSDIGISWVPDDEWSRGKCGLKVLQYMAAGLPVIANPVGVHSTIISHGKTGLLASTSQEWCEAIQQLVKSTSRRMEMGAAGRAALHRSFRVEIGAERWLRLLERLEKKDLFTVDRRSST